MTKSQTAKRFFDLDTDVQGAFVELYRAQGHRAGGREWRELEYVYDVALDADDMENALSTIEDDDEA